MTQFFIRKFIYQEVFEILGKIIVDLVRSVLVWLKVQLVATSVAPKMT